MIRLVTSLNQLFELAIRLSIGFCIVYHFLDFFFGQTRRSLDGNFLLTTGVFVFSRNVQDTISIQVEGDFDLRHTAWCSLNTIQVELTQRFVIYTTFTLTLHHVDGYRRLVVFCGREHLAVLSRDGGVL